MSEQLVVENDSSQYLAALDIGSNSFHFVLARRVGEHLQILHSEKYRTQLAQGLNADDILDAAAIERGLNTLAGLSSATEHLSASNFRAVATFTLRQAKNADQFLKAAAKVFPFDIEIISGHEEARLIYQGVSHHIQFEDNLLVVDIGGGSTECIIGKQEKIAVLASLNMGCVSYTQRYFDPVLITEKAFKLAIRSAKHEVDSIVKRFKKTGWQSALGTSGTIKSIYNVINFGEHIPQPIRLQQVVQLKETLIACQNVENIDLDCLKENRRDVFCAGVAIVIAVMESLNIEQLDYCQYALREGVLYEKFDTLKNDNIRQRTVNSLIERFNIDKAYTNTVENLVVSLFHEVKVCWQLTSPIYYELLLAAVQLHELGLDINSSGYHKHGEYILTHADLAGFNQEQQQALAWLVGNQRKKITPLNDNQWYLLAPRKLEKLCILLRLAILLNQQRHLTDTLVFQAAVTPTSLTLTIDKQWLNERPIVDTELFFEQELIALFAIALTIAS